MESISQPTVAGAKRRPLWRAALLASTCVSGIFSAAAAHAQSLPADTTPTGGTVAAGSASITQAPDLTTINQTSQKTIIDWQTFNVGSAATVQFNQPSPAATALNYVITPSPSIIAGKIDANGQLILVNQSGIIFTKGSEVDAQALVATTSSISDEDFLAGKMNFTGAPRPGAKIVNDGKITVADTGLVGLIAPQVANNGVITAKLGQVVLAGASAFTLDLYGDRLISLDVTKAVQAVDVGGKLVPALVTNSGLILADGGKITLTAQDADALVTQLVNAGGTIRADSVGTDTGTISITGVGGNISIAGNLLAQGVAAGTKGGAVQALTDGTVAVAAGATINTSGDAGGGVIALGTNITRAQQGAADTSAPRANTILVNAGAVLLSDATGTGNGGEVTLLSTNYTDFAGAISVQGGPNGGNGGLAEISSGNVINLSGTVADLAPHGRNGEILLDPATLVVGSGTIAAGSVVSGSSATFGTDSSTTSYISPSVLDTLTGTIVLEATSLVSVTDAVSITGSGTALTITSGGDVSVSNSIYVNGSLEIDASNSLSIEGGLSAAGNMLLSSGTAGSYIDAPVSAGNVLALVSPGTIFEDRAGGVTAATLTSGTAADGDVTLAQLNFLDLSPNQVGTLGAFNASSLNLSDASTLSVTGPVAASGNITINAGNIDIAGSIASANLSLFSSSQPGQSTGSITESTGAISTGTFSGTALDSITLNSASNTIAALGNVTAGDGNSGSANELILTSTGELIVAGTVSAAGNPSGDIMLSAGSIDVAGSLISTTLTLNSGGDISESTGAISVGTLSGSASGNVTLSGGSNNISALGSFSADHFALSNSGFLYVDGPVSGTGGVALSAAGIEINGAVSGKTLSLTSSANISEAGTGTISTGTLSGSAAGSISLGGLSNTIATLGSLSAGSLLLTNTGSLSVAGPVDVTNGIILKAAGIDIAGSVTSDYLYLNSQYMGRTGAITESTGIINTGTLSAVSFDDITLNNTANKIGTLSNISAASGALGATNNVVLSNSGSLDVAGPVYASGDITLSAGGLNLAGNLTGQTLSLASTGDITQSGGEITASVLYGTASGNVTLSSSSNTIQELGNFSAHNLVLSNSGGLVVTGPIVATGDVALRAVGITLVGSLSSANLSLTSASSITESTGAISTGTLSGSATDDLSLNGTDNSIANIGSLSAADIIISNAASLSIAGPVSASGFITLSSAGMDIAGTVTSAELALNSSSGAITESTGTINTGTLMGAAVGNVTLNGAGNSISTLGSFSAAELLLTDTGSLALAGNVSIANLLQLAGLTGGVTQTSGTLSAGTFGSLGSLAGDVILTDAGNQIGTLGGLTLASNMLDLIDAGTLNIAGPVVANTASISASAIDLTGSILTGAALDLTNTGAGGITLAGLASVGSVLSLSSDGTVSETGTLTAATLTGSGTLGNVELISAHNNIGTLGAYSLAGNALGLDDNSSLIIAGPVVASTASIASLSSLTVTGSLTSAGSLVLSGTSLIALDGFVDAGTALVLQSPANITETGTVIAADLTSGTITDGSVILSDGFNTIGGIASLASDGSFSAGTLSLVDQVALNIGSLTANYVTLAAPEMTFTGNVAASNVLALASPGSIGQSGGTISAGTLTSDGSSDGATSLTDSGNAIASVGSFSASSFSLTDAGLLTITGPLTTTGNTTLTAGTIILNGSLTSAALALASNSSISQTGGAINTGTLTGSAVGNVTLNGAGNSIATLGSFSAAALLLTDTGSLALAGNVSIANLLQLAGLTGGVTQTSGTLSAGTFGSLGSLAGDVILTDAGNQIGTLGGLTLASNMLDLIDAGTLNIAGPVVANTASISASAIDLTGSILTGAALDLTNTGAGGITLAGLASVGSVLSLSSDGTVSETGTLTAATLTGSGTLGNVELISAHNNIGTLGAYSLAGNALGLDDNSSLIIAGPVVASTASIASLSSLTVTGSLTSAGSLVLSGTSLIALDGFVDAGTALVLQSPANITETGTVIAADLTSGTITDGSVVLSDGFNTIGGIASLASDGSFSAGTLSLVDQAALNIGSLTANYVTLSAPEMTFTGNVAASNVLALASPGSIGQSGGTISAGTLTSDGSSDGATSLTDSGNAIASVGSFSASSFSLTDAGLLTITGPLTTTGNTTLTAGTIILNGSLTSAALALVSNSSISQTGGTVETGTLTGSAVGNVTLNGAGNSISTLGSFSAAELLLTDTGSLALAGNVSITNLLQLAGLTGGVTQTSGTLSAGTLGSAGALAGDVILTDAGNQIGTLGGLTLASNMLDLIDAGTLNIAGPVIADNASISASAIDLTGSIFTAAALDLTNTGAGGITLAGLASVGSVLSLSSDGTVSETGTLTAATLTGSGTLGNVELISAHNNIGTLDAYSLAGNALGLDDNSSLIIAGPVLANTASIASLSSLTVTGSLTSAGSLVLSGTSLIALDGFVDAGTALVLQSPANITETGTVIAADLTSGTITDGSVILSDGFNTIGGIASLASDGSFSAGTLSLVDQAALNIGSLTANYVTLAAPEMTFTGNVAASNVLALASPGSIGQSGGTISAGTLTSDGTTDGATSLTEPGNAIASVGSFSASSFSLTDAGLLTITGPLNTTGNSTLTAGTIILNGTLTSAALALASNSSISQTGGAINTGTLTGAAVGNVTLNGAGNSIATLGSFSAAALLLTDTGSLALAGNVSIANLLQLAGLTGGVTQTSGMLSAGTFGVLGSLAGDVILTDAGNQIGTLGGLTLASNMLDLIDAGTLNIAGPVVANTASISASAIDLTGSILTGAALDLTNTGSGGITLAGLASVGSVLSLSSDGTVSETGTLTAATLTGSGTLGNVELISAHNNIGTLGAYSLAGNALGLDDNSSLIIAGPVLANTASITSYSSLTDTGSLTSAGSLVLSGTSLIALDGFVDAGTALVLQSPANITETGTVIAADLTSGTITDGSVILSDGFNTIGGIASLASDGSFSAGTLSLVDQAALNIGSLTANYVTLAAPEMTFTGNVAASNVLALASPGSIGQSGGTISAGTLTSDGTTDGATSLTEPGNAIASVGSFSASSFSLIDAGLLTITGPLTTTGNSTLTAGTIILNGTLTSADLNLSSAGSIDQTGGLIDTAGLTITAGGNVAISSVTNLIDGLGSLGGGAGNFSLSDATALTISNNISALNITLASAGLTINGTLQTGNLQISSTGPVTESGVIDAATLTTGTGTITGAVDLNGNNSIASLGNFAATGNISLYDTEPLSLTGAIFSGSTLALGNSSNITQTGGLITAGALTSDGGTIGGDVSLDQSNNDIATLGTFAAAGNISLVDASSLNLDGDVTAGGGTLGLFSPGALSQSAGTIGAGLLNASAASITLLDSNSINALGNVVTGGSLAANGVSGISGTVTAQNASLSTPGNFTLAGNISVSNSLTISAVGNISQPSGTLTAQTAAFNTTQPGDAISLSGTDFIAGDLNFSNAGEIIHGAGVLDAGTLTGTSGSLASFTGLTDIGTIGNFIMSDSLFSLDNSGILTITGPLVANVISITATGQLILAGSPGGGLFFTGNIAGNTAQAPRDGLDSVLTVVDDNGAPGIVETGVFYLNADGGTGLYNGLNYSAITNLSATIFFITTAGPSSPGGNVNFAAAPNGLFGPSVDVVIDAGTTGEVMGNVNLYHLEIINALETNLTGTVDGVNGQPASGKASATDPSSKYQFNACPIGSVDCVVLNIESLPNGNPLGDFDITERKRRRLDKNVQLPGIAMHDF